MEHERLAAFLITARTRRRLTQQELANIAQLHKQTVGKIERCMDVDLTQTTLTAIGLALHEVFPLTETEIVEFSQLTNVPMHIFAETRQLSERDAERRLIQPIVDRMLNRFTAESVLVFMQSLEALMTTLKLRAAAELDDQVVTHVSAPKYRPDLGGTEQVFTQYGKPAPSKPKHQPKSGGKHA